jgi:SPP1 family predicted phage head-tail adaptor
MRGVNAGELRHIVEIQDYVNTQDASGDDIRSYGIGSSAFATVHASIKTLRGRELYAAQQLFAEADVEIRIRYRYGVTERMRVYHQHEGAYYDILNVNDVERRHEEMILTCKTGPSTER